MILWRLTSSSMPSLRQALTDCRIVIMLFHMKTTLIIPDHLVRLLKRRAAERGTTLSAVVAETLRRGLEAVPEAELEPLPAYRMGRARLDVADRDALYRAMEGV